MDLNIPYNYDNEERLDRLLEQNWLSYIRNNPKRVKSE